MVSFRPPIPAAALLAGLAAAACGGSVSTAGPATPEAGGVTRRDTAIVHEACDLKAAGGELLDANGDGKADVTIVRKGGSEVCRAVDLNFDGKIDVFVYVDEQGKVRRRESDYDRDGRVDEIAVFQAGALAELHRASTLRGKLDTWQYYRGGKLARTERDSDGDGIIDQWWEYPGVPECPMIHTDTNGDGRPDPGSTVDYCKETGYVPPERQGSQKTTGPSFERAGGDTPTEVDDKPAGGDGEKPAGGDEKQPEGDK
ncbi:MAG: hypothetical protein IT376_17055 [Polyangiaceae bacterium]|nr:hypothetical protein [Polyangiaceae bacterium]